MLQAQELELGFGQLEVGQVVELLEVELALGPEPTLGYGVAVDWRKVARLGGNRGFDSWKRRVGWIQIEVASGESWIEQRGGPVEKSIRKDYCLIDLVEEKGVDCTGRVVGVGIR